MGKATKRVIVGLLLAVAFTFATPKHAKAQMLPCQGSYTYLANVLMSMAPDPYDTESAWYGEFSEYVYNTCGFPGSIDLRYNMESAFLVAVANGQCGDALPSYCGWAFGVYYLQSHAGG